MTQNALKLLNKLKQQDRQARRFLKRSASPERRDRMMSEFNHENLDDVGPLGGHDQSMRVLGEMNELGKAQEQTIRDSFPRIDLL
jgi:hypothetical protein